MSLQLEKERPVEEPYLNEYGESLDLEEYLFNIICCLPEENEASNLLFLLRYE